MQDHLKQSIAGTSKRFESLLTQRQKEKGIGTRFIRYWELPGYIMNPISCPVFVVHDVITTQSLREGLIKKTYLCTREGQRYFQTEEVSNSCVFRSLRMMEERGIIL